MYVLSSFTGIKKEKLNHRGSEAQRDRVRLGRLPLFSKLACALRAQMIHRRPAHEFGERPIISVPHRLSGESCGVEDRRRRRPKNQKPGGSKERRAQHCVITKTIDILIKRGKRNRRALSNLSHCRTQTPRFRRVGVAIFVRILAGAENTRIAAHFSKSLIFSCYQGIGA